jgi:galactokinase
MPDLDQRDEFDAARRVPYHGARLHPLRHQRRQPPRGGFTRGYDCTIHGTIPINAGASSSSALTVAWVSFSWATQTGSLPGSPEETARLAHLAEVVEFGEPGGMMDHYTSAVGGLLFIDCREPITVERLPAQLDGFVLGDSLQPKDTTGVLGKSRSAVEAGLAVLRDGIPEFDFRTTSLAEVEPLLGQMPEESGGGSSRTSTTARSAARRTSCSAPSRPIRLGSASCSTLITASCATGSGSPPRRSTDG